MPTPFTTSKGPRGPVAWLFQVYVPEWSDEAARSALDAAGFGAPQWLDTLTAYNAELGFSETRQFSKLGQWGPVTLYLDGAHLVS